MSRKPKARSKDRSRKYRVPNDMMRVATTMFKLTDKDRSYIQDRPYHSLMNLRDRHCTLMTLGPIMIRITYARLSAVEFIEADTIKAIVDTAYRAVDRIIERFDTTGVVGLSGGDFKALQDALGVADSVDDHLLRREQVPAYVKAVELTNRHPRLKPGA